MTPRWERVHVGLGLVGLCFVAAMAVLFTGEWAAIFLVLAAFLFGLTVGRISGARPWRSLVQRSFEMGREVERMAPRPRR